LLGGSQSDRLEAILDLEFIIRIDLPVASRDERTGDKGNGQREVSHIER
jgi:hypothetical protein